MKTTIFSAVVAIASLLDASTFAAGTCANGGLSGAQRPAGGPNFGPVAPADPSIGVPGSPFATNRFATTSLPTSTAAVPKARITVADSASSNTATGSHTAPTARITLASASDTAAPKAEEIAKAEKNAPAVAETTLPAALKGLTGTWLAVARHGEGELGTIELQLDERGWAKLTVPGTDGKPSTSERRVKFEDQELKLQGGGSELSLGKLIESSERQIVLARADGNVTFVKP